MNLAVILRARPDWQEHEVAMGDALLEGKDTDQARQTAEVVKDQEESTK